MAKTKKKVEHKETPKAELKTYRFEVQRLVTLTADILVDAVDEERASDIASKFCKCAGTEDKFCDCGQELCDCDPNVWVDGNWDEQDDEYNLEGDPTLEDPDARKMEQLEYHRRQIARLESEP